MNTCEVAFKSVTYCIHTEKKWLTINLPHTVTEIESHVEVNKINSCCKCLVLNGHAEVNLSDRSLTKVNKRNERWIFNQLTRWVDHGHPWESCAAPRNIQNKFQLLSILQRGSSGRGCRWTRQSTAKQMHNICKSYVTNSSRWFI